MAESSAQGQIKRRRLPQRSPQWKDFTLVKGDDGKDKAKCNRCGKLYAISGENNNNYGTTNLKKHRLEGCVEQEAADVGAAPPPLLPTMPLPCAPPRPGGPSDRDPGLQEASKHHLARMIALGGHDPSVLEDDGFRKFVASLNPDFELPSRVVIEEMCDGIFDEVRRDLLDRLGRAPYGSLSLALGKTETLEAGEVRYIACHCIDDEWKLQRLVLNVLVREGLREDGSILGLSVVPNAENYVSDFLFEHGPFMVASDWDIGPALKEHILDVSGRNPSTYVDHVLHSIARCLLPDSGFIVHEDMLDLNLTRQELRQLLSELDLDYEWAYNQPWCACYYSFEVLAKRGNKFGDKESFVKLLCKVWKQIYRGIQKISAASTCPTSNLCLAELLKVRVILQPELARFSGDDADVQHQYDYFYDDRSLEDALREATDTLDKAIQDSYLVWSVPLALDPRYKLTYIEFSFKRAFGSTEAATYLSKIKENINNMYSDYIEAYDADHSDSANAMIATTTSTDPLEQDWIEHRTETETELNRYLQDPLVPVTETQDFDILNWWKVHSSEYPMVARMARDALAMPTCSKLSSDQLAQVRSLLRGYSKGPLCYFYA